MSTRDSMFVMTKSPNTKMPPPVSAVLLRTTVRVSWIEAGPCTGGLSLVDAAKIPPPLPAIVPAESTTLSSMIESVIS